MVEDSTSTGASPELIATLRGPFRHRDLQGQNALVEPGLNRVRVEALTEEQLPAEAALGPLADDGLVTIGAVVG